MSEEEKNKNKVNEPAVEYTTQEIVFFNSFEEMNESQYKYWANISPEQRLADHYKLITQIYKDEIEKNKQSLYDKIIFKNEFSD